MYQIEIEHCGIKYIEQLQCMYQKYEYQKYNALCNEDNIIILTTNN